MARSFAGSQPGGPSASLAELHAVVHVSQAAEIAKTKLMLAKQQCTGCLHDTGCAMMPDSNDKTIELWLKQNACNTVVMSGLAQLADRCKRMRLLLILAQMHKAQQLASASAPMGRGPLSGSVPDGVDLGRKSVNPAASPAAFAVQTALGNLPASRPGAPLRRHMPPPPPLVPLRAAVPFLRAAIPHGVVVVVVRNSGGHGFNPLSNGRPTAARTGSSAPAALAQAQRERPFGDMGAMLNTGLGAKRPKLKHQSATDVFASTPMHAAPPPAAATSATSSTRTQQPPPQKKQKKCMLCFIPVTADADAIDCTKCPTSVVHLKCLRKGGHPEPKTLREASRYECLLCESISDDEAAADGVGDEAARRLSGDFRAADDEAQEEAELQRALAESLAASATAAAAARAQAGPPQGIVDLDDDQEDQQLQAVVRASLHGTPGPGPGGLTLDEPIWL